MVSLRSCREQFDGCGPFNVMSTNDGLIPDAPRPVAFYRVARGYFLVEYHMS